ncbi:MAG: L,D-transpeptidase [Actinobacteria bacterium]|nr:L,D-transpeptidase [Actinomycetota bacterium]
MGSARSPATSRPWRLIAVVVGLVTTSSVAAQTAAGATDGSPAREHAAALQGTATTVARILAPSAVRRRPGAGQVFDRLPTAWRDGGGPVRLLVLEARTDSRGRPTFVRVLLPRRPNGTSGWVNANHVKLERTPWRIEISRGERTLTVRRAGVVVRRIRVVVGKASTPTPGGITAVVDHTRTDPGGFVGSWVLRLALHSNVIRTELGRGRVAIHGRGGRSLRTPLGTAASHGCIRLANGDVEWLARIAKPGTPVVIR